MARRVALIPEELISSHHYQDPELRLEDEIASLLDRKKIPDDMKAKLLSQLVMRYQKTVHAPLEPIPVTVQSEQTSENEEKQKQTDESSFENGGSYEKQDAIMKNILISTPLRFKKYVPMIAEKLKTRNYFWNSEGEMTMENKPIKGSNVVDCFAYLFRNARTKAEPHGFDFFLKALTEINIPRAWIANKLVLEKLQTKKIQEDDVFLPEATSSPYNEREGSSSMKSESALGKRGRELKSHSFYPTTSGSKKWARSRSHSPMKKWLEY